jgi:hypothetical protein
MPAGRPLKFNSAGEILKQGMEFFEKCRQQNRPITITGLCIALGTYRDVLMDYQDERGEEFSNAVKTLKIFCENYAEEQVFVGKNCAGAIFALKNYGWKDKSDHSMTDGEGKPLSMSPIIQMVDFDKYLIFKNNASTITTQFQNTENGLQGFLGAETDKTDTRSASTDGHLQ